MQDSRRDAAARPDGPPAQEPTDEELDAYILARLALLGVDLSVLPEEDPHAPADRARILESAREFVREAPPAIAALELDPEDGAPALYPAEWRAWTEGSEG